MELFLSISYVAMSFVFVVALLVFWNNESK